MRWAASLVVAAAWLTCPAVVRAEDRTVTTSVTGYGRANGDVDLSAGAGVVVGPGGERGEVELRARYLESAGIFAAYEDGAHFGSGADPTRVLSAGLELRPLFLYRWLQGHEAGSARLDLLIDSFGVELGAILFQPPGESLSQTGLEVGLGFEFPILPRASGLWVGLHGGVRWADAALASGRLERPDDRAAFLAVTLAWHEVILTHLVDWQDGLRR